MTEQPLRITQITTTGITAGFRHWPEAVQARDLMQRGNELSAVTYYESGSDIIGQRQETIDGIRIRRVPFDRLWRAPELGKSLDAFRPQVLQLFHLRNALNHAAVTWAKKHGVPTVFTVVGPFHDPYLVDDRERPYAGAVHYEQLIYSRSELLSAMLRQRRPQRVWQNYLMHWPLRAADRVIALSQHEVGLLQKMGVSKERIRLVPLWVDAEFIADLAARAAADLTLTADLPAGKQVVLFIGQLKIRKGYDLLARAMPLVLAQQPDTVFVFAGQNPAQAQELRSIVAANDSESALLLLGRVSEEAKVALMGRAACLVYPTRYESFGLPPLEAMVVGTPVVSTNLPVVSEMIEDGHNGLLAAPEDPISLAGQILRLLQSPALRQQLIANGHQIARTRYNAAALTAQLEAVYREVV